MNRNLSIKIIRTAVFTAVLIMGYSCRSARIPTVNRFTEPTSGKVYVWQDLLEHSVIAPGLKDQIKDFEMKYPYKNTKLGLEIALMSISPDSLNFILQYSHDPLPINGAVVLLEPTKNGRKMYLRLWFLYEFFELEWSKYNLLTDYIAPEARRRYGKDMKKSVKETVPRLSIRLGENYESGMRFLTFDWDGNLIRSYDM